MRELSQLLGVVTVTLIVQRHGADARLPSQQTQQTVTRKFTATRRYSFAVLRDAIADDRAFLRRWRRRSGRGKGDKLESVEDCVAVRLVATVVEFLAFLPDVLASATPWGKPYWRRGGEPGRRAPTFEFETKSAFEVLCGERREPLGSSWLLWYRE